MRTINLSRSVQCGLAALLLSTGVERSAPVFASAGQQLPVEEARTPETLDEVRSLIRSGRYAEAEEHARKLLEGFEVEYGTDSLQVAQALDVIVEARFRGGKAREPESRELGKRAVEIKEKELGPDHLEVAVSLYSYAVVFSISGEYAEAKPLFERALAIREKALGPDHPLVGASLNGLANLLGNVGDYEGQRRAHQRALAIREKALGPDHLDVAVSLGNLANTEKRMGEYTTAREHYERALAIREKALGSEHPDVARVLNNLASLLLAMGDYDRARILYEHALTIREKILDPNHPDMAQSLHNLAELFRETGQYSEAKPLYERALRIKEKAFGPEHPLVASTLGGLAIVYSETGDFTKSKSLHERALAIVEKRLSPEHHLLVPRLYFLASLLLEMERYSEAKPLFERAQAIAEKIHGPHHPDVASNLLGLAQIHAQAGDAVAAIDAALRAEAIGREHLRLTVRTLPERQAMRYASVRISGLHLALSLAARSVDAASKQKVWDALIHSRAIMLDEMAARHRTISGAVDIVELAQALVSAQQKLANLTVRGLSQHPPERYRRLLNEARLEKERAERALAEKSVVFQQEQARSRVGLVEVSPALTRGSALVAFARYNDTVGKPVPAEPSMVASSLGIPEFVASYLAFVLRSGDAVPTAVRLGSAEEIESLVSRWKEEIVKGAGVRRGTAKSLNDSYRRIGESLRQKVWDPITSHFREAKRVFVVPDGVLNLVSLAALPAGEDRYLVETGPLLHYLSAERELLQESAQSARSEGLLALGGADFNEASFFSALAPQRKAPGESSGAGMRGAFSYSGARPACSEFESVLFAPLPATAREAKEVVDLWRSTGGRGESIHLSGAGASESAFKQQAPGRRVLHVATHGFFLGERCPSALSSSRSVGGVVVGEAPPLGG